MHEAAITSALLEQVAAAMPPTGHLARCTVAVGRLEHLDPLVMQTIWRASTIDTRFDGAQLTILHTPLRVRCRACNHTYQPEDHAIMLCPACGRVLPEVLEGAGVILKSLEVEGV